MKSFISAFKEFLEWQTVESTQPKLIWFNDKWMVTPFYSHELLKKIGSEVVCG